ncbi:MAG: GNAT family N-acetyltransferase [Alphaproteobacteria bacterium]|nr:GNAT family N-acetyltransferase [Alphaproteobacteria bacterium]
MGTNATIHVEEGPVATKVAMTMEESLQAFAVCAACFIGEQDIPYSEEFDGHDFGATHILALVGSEPVGAVRLRWFQSFAMPERISVVQRHRGRGIARQLLEQCRQLAERRGCRMLYTQAPPRDVAAWERLGWRRLDTAADEDDRGYVALARPVDPAATPEAVPTPELLTLRPEPWLDRPARPGRTEVN